MDNGDDQEILTTIYTTLMSAEKVAKVLNVELIAESEVNDDVFVFMVLKLSPFLCKKIIAK